MAFLRQVVRPICWRLEQLEPGLIRWTGPSGRSYTTTPTVIDL